MKTQLKLNESAKLQVDILAATATEHRIALQTLPSGARLMDCGIKTEGGIGAGLELARVCLAGLAEVSMVPGEVAGLSCPHVQVWTDWPVAACLASQYAGWRVSVGKFFAMGSGPMRAAAGREALYDQIGYREDAESVVGVLETDQLPDETVVQYLCERTRVTDPMLLTLLLAPTASQAGAVQVVARSVETALHKLAELRFDLSRVVSGYGTAPLPPVAAKFVEAIGRPNDAILYGGRVTLWVRGDDESLAEIGPKVPSGASADHGVPFAELFARYGGDFYKIDKHLFSPAEIAFCNLSTGRTHRFGQLAPDVLRRSFYE